MNALAVPDRYNYVGVFLTLRCGRRCSYCINRFQDRRRGVGEELAAAQWIEGLNRLALRSDLPVSLQGGEPSLHPGFIPILQGLRPEIPIDILTNLDFDVERFAGEIDPSRLRRDAPYASIRVSYHPETMELEPLLEKVLYLQDAGFSVGVWGVAHPDQLEEVSRAQERCQAKGIDFRTKEFLGFHGGNLVGTYRYAGSVGNEETQAVLCRTSELLIGPSGSVYRCHADLYGGRDPIGHILDPGFAIEDVHRPCGFFGHCNPCDLKVKTNRYQQFGHTSVDIIPQDE
ncbi:MAG: hypothetical protein P1P84_07120 [Deferrisomatales bacterium]|nr:hypothetical protein [Deferrisomatales bacterium]